MAAARGNDPLPGLTAGLYHRAMSQRTSRSALLAAVAALALLGGCERPTRDAATLEAIRAEAQALMAASPGDVELSEARWPRTIARLRPEFVMITSDGVHITTKAHFDGGWGYFVPRKARVVPEPAERFADAGHGVYWWHPY